MKGLIIGLLLSALAVTGIILFIKMRSPKASKDPNALYSAPVNSPALPITIPSDVIVITPTTKVNPAPMSAQKDEVLDKWGRTKEEIQEDTLQYGSSPAAQEGAAKNKAVTSIKGMTRRTADKLAAELTRKSESGSSNFQLEAIKNTMIAGGWKAVWSDEDNYYYAVIA